ncbi:amidohydrolase family protein [Sphingomonas sp. HF-S4]|uniref:Amidohydrolase family protein n=1 Tax=Sphingomonas agrestis TaxID=3080540 RepID=A0ABU3Y9U6_9SPHN|nr:amidohydrolase family protein [Sphingomonas sp. HF-S4]MDV3457927.1 amidohydrolase family protein [Sphingomonas sp. HF-S4]
MPYEITRRGFVASGAAAMLCGPAFAAAGTLDVALTNAQVWTGSGMSDAVGISGNRIAALGARAVRSAMGPKTRVIDCKGAFVMPAFIDCHTHFLLGSPNLTQPDLLEVRSREEWVDRIGKAVREVPKGQWLAGGPWDEQRFGGQLPRKEWVDAVSADTPIAIPRTDLHSLFLNSAALKLAGIDRNTPDVPGGVIERDEKGEPTGVLKDNARNRVLEVIPPPTEAMVDAYMRSGIDNALSKGVAQIHNTEIDWSVQDAARRLRQKGPTGLRFYSFVPLADWARMADLVKAEGKGDDWVRWGGLKCVSDGSLGARTARFYAPYVDAHDQRGVWSVPVEDMKRWIPAADAAGLHLTTHAIGDEANDVVLDIYRDAAQRNGRRDRRFRIEHAQHLAPGAWTRMAQQKIIASVQPYHAADDGRWAVKRIGEERLKRTYAFNTLLKAGVKTCFGSDWPVAPIDPLTGIDAAVQRHTIDGANPNGWHPEQRISIEQTLTAYTQTAAYAGFQEDRLGRIAPGYLADLVVLDRNLLTVPADQYLKTSVLRTFVDGVERFTGPAA